MPPTATQNWVWIAPLAAILLFGAWLVIPAHPLVALMLFVGLLGAVIAGVHHADVVAHRSVAAASFFVALMACAQEPVQNIDHERHGNLATAQDLVRQAYDKVSEAQEDSHGELGGHAAKAKELLRQANQEIKLAAETANHR